MRVLPRIGRAQPLTPMAHVQGIPRALTECQTGLAVASFFVAVDTETIECSWIFWRRLLRAVICVEAEVAPKHDGARHKLIGMAMETPDRRRNPQPPRPHRVCAPAPRTPSIRRADKNGS